VHLPIVFFGVFAVIIVNIRQLCIWNTAFYRNGPLCIRDIKLHDYPWLVVRIRSAENSHSYADRYKLRGGA